LDTVSKLDVGHTWISETGAAASATAGLATRTAGGATTAEIATTTTTTTTTGARREDVARTGAARATVRTGPGLTV
jgi:hypothetical protein